MNKFRNNLHPMFFFPGSNGNSESLENREGNEKELVVEQVSQETTELKENIAQVPDFSNVAGTVASEVSPKYTDMEKLKRDRKRFQERLKSKSDNGNGEEYVKVWEKKIKNGFDYLIKLLEDNNYFDDCKDTAAKNTKIAEVLVKYSKEVYSQYEDYIWAASNSKFDANKDTIFGQNSNDYPANIIYKQLTGATSIYKTNRKHTEGYDSEIIDWTDVADDDKVDIGEKQNRDFLSNDLPMYLWNIRKTPGVLKALSFLPIFSMREDRPSKVDRKAIKQFLKISSKIEVDGSKDKAVALMEVFHDNSLNTDSGREDYKRILNKHGIKVDDKYLDGIVKAGSFYINTQSDNNSLRSQHAIYLSVLKIVENEGGVDSAVKKFKAIVEQSEKDNKAEKKEGYNNGEKLAANNPELYEIAKNLGITDFTSATRLSEKSSDYFKNTPIEKILANLNNDRTIDARDTIAGGSKTGVQFLEIFNMVKKEKALPNLVARAKLLNKTQNIGLPDAIINADTIEKDIKGGHVGLILLLQNVINNPGEDLYTLLSGHTENPFDGVDMKAAKAEADKLATEMAGKINLSELEKAGVVNLPTPESMQSGLAATLYTEYTRGIGLGNKISFDQWVKGMEMNTGFQIRNDGSVVIGIGLDYRKSINLGKGWSTTPELSAGAFIPLGYGKPDLTGSVGLNDEIAKERITSKGIKQHLGLQGGITLMPSGVTIASVGFKRERDKAAGIDTAEKEKGVEFRDKIMSPILENIAKTLVQQGKTKLDFNDPEVVRLIKQDLKLNADKLIKSDELKKYDIKTEKAAAVESVVNATTRLLLPYNGADISNEGIRNTIAQGTAEQYAMAWTEDRKAHISKSTYLSGASLGVFWVTGAPLVGVYAGIKRKDHDLDGYGDRWGKEQEIGQEYQGEWNETMINSLNQQLGLSEKDQIKIENGLIVLPKSLIHRVNVNKKMIDKKLMKKDENGNVLLHTQTPMAADIKKGAATKGSELTIGGRKGGEFVKLDTIGDESFTSGDIDQNDILELGEGINNYTPEVLNKVLDGVKKEAPEGDPIKVLDFTMFSNIDDLINKLNALDKTKKARILIVTDDNGEIYIKDPLEGESGRGLEIKYQPRIEMIDRGAKKVADAVYAEALKVKNPKALNAVKHDKDKQKHWPEYDPFNDAMQNKDYQAARDKIKPIFAKLDVQIAGANFTEIGNKLDELEGDALAQALMSINNIFARSVKVRGGGKNYEFKGWNEKGKEVPVSMGSIIAEREKQISETIKNYKGENITDDVKTGYQSLINSSKLYREKSKVFDKITSAKAAQLDNTVGFNLGDKTNPENPLFNPEIYDPMVDLDVLSQYGFDETAKNTLHKRAMELFANNPALINPVLKALGIENPESVQIKNFEKSEEGKGKLTLDIGGKIIITLKSGMKFGYFTQCVNHTVILDNLSAETSDGASVNFNSGVWEGTEYREGNKASIVSTVEFGVHGSVTFNTEKKEEEKKGDATTTPTEVEEDIPGDGSTIPGKEDGSTIPGKEDGGLAGADDNPSTPGGGQDGKQEGGRDSSNAGGDTTPPVGGKGGSGTQEGGRNDD